MKLVIPLAMFMATLTENGDTAMILNCLQDCGKEHGLVVHVDDEAAFCECADWNAQGRLER